MKRIKLIQALTFLAMASSLVACSKGNLDSKQHIVVDRVCSTAAELATPACQKKTTADTIPTDAMVTERAINVYLSSASSETLAADLKLSDDELADVKEALFAGAPTEEQMALLADVREQVLVKFNKEINDLFNKVSGKLIYNKADKSIDLELQTTEVRVKSVEDKAFDEEGNAKEIKNGQLEELTVTYVRTPEINKYNVTKDLDDKQKANYFLNLENAKEQAQPIATDAIVAEKPSLSSEAKDSLTMKLHCTAEACEKGLLLIEEREADTAELLSLTAASFQVNNAELIFEKSSLPADLYNKLMEERAQDATISKLDEAVAQGPMDELVVTAKRPELSAADKARIDAEIESGLTIEELDRADMLAAENAKKLLKEAQASEISGAPEDFDPQMAMTMGESKDEMAPKAALLNRGSGLPADVEAAKGIESHEDAHGMDQ